MPKILYRPSGTHVWYNSYTELLVLGRFATKKKHLFNKTEVYRLEFENGTSFEFEHLEDNFFKDNKFDFIGFLE